MKWQPSRCTLAVMSTRDSKSKQTLPEQHGDEPVSGRSLGEEVKTSVPRRPLRVGAHVVPGADGPRLAASRLLAPNKVRKWRLRRLGDWLSAVVADDGMRERFAAERQRDEELVRRVERRRRA